MEQAYCVSEYCTFVTFDEEYGCETSGLVAHGVDERSIEDDDEEGVEEVLEVKTVSVSLLHCLVSRQLVGWNKSYWI